MSNTVRGILLREEPGTLVVQAEPAEVAAFASRREEGVILARLRPMPAGSNVMTTSPVFAGAFSSGDFPQAIAGAMTRQEDFASRRQQHGDPHWIANGLLYDSTGRPVAQITRADIDADALDVTSFGDTSSRFIRGAPRVRIEATGL